MLRKIKIIDTNFAHAKYSTDYQLSKYIEWDRNTPINENDVVFLSDNSMLDVEKYNGKKIGMIMEPKSINPAIYNWVRNNHTRFQTILTYDKELIDSFNNITFYPHSGCWIKPEDQLIYPKTKLVSIIASNKAQTDGHRLRHDAISLAKANKINLAVFGRGYNPIDYKLTALKDYAFSIIIENTKYDYYFTEKLIDSFMTGTIPVYWGCPSIGKFFNLDGMIIFNDLTDLLNQLNSLSLDKYNSMIEAVKENFEKACRFIIAEDWIYEHTNIFK